MPLAESHFANALNALFELGSEHARRLLPAHLEPLELRHGTALLSVSAFDFTSSPFGPYAELALSVIVAPRAPRDGVWPRAAYFPLVIAANRREPRELGSEQLHLPYWSEDVPLKIEPRGASIGAALGVGASSIVSLDVYEHSWQPERHTYQCFLSDASGDYVARVVMSGEESEHDDGRGTLRLAAHPLLKGLDACDVFETPVREIWMRSGTQILEDLAPLSAA